MGSEYSLSEAVREGFSEKMGRASGERNCLMKPGPGLRLLCSGTNTGDNKRRRVVAEPANGLLRLWDWPVYRQAQSPE